jgi:hypothetical protein
VLLAVLLRMHGQQAAAALLATVRQIAANSKICKEVSDDGVLCCLELTARRAGVVRRWRAADEAHCSSRPSEAL